MPELGQLVLPSHPTNLQEKQGPHSLLTDEASFLKSGLGYSIPSSSVVTTVPQLLSPSSPGHTLASGYSWGPGGGGAKWWLIPALQGGHFLSSQQSTWYDPHLHKE